MKILLEQRDCRHDHPGSAVSALQGFFVEKGLLHGVKLIAVRQTFNRSNLLLPNRGRFGDAGPLRFAANQHSTGAALAFATSVLCTGEIQLLAENAEERGLGIGFNGDGSSVHDKAKTAHSTTKSGQMGNVPSDDISGGSVDRIQSTPLNEQSRECDSE
jgi:hypothetical protein